MKFFSFIFLSLAVVGCSVKTHGKTELIVWGMSQGEYMIGTYAAIDAFEQLHPGVRVVLSTSGRTLGPQKLLTAIVGGVPPDVIFQDRFTIAGWASRDAFVPLDSFVARDESELARIEKTDFYRATWEEAVYRNMVYAIPYDVDVRVLYYNKSILRSAGLINHAGQAIPPRTWKDLMEYNRKLTIVSRDGNFARIGFLPLYGPGTFYLYALEAGGHFLSADGMTCTMTDSPIVKALTWLVHYYDSIGGRSLSEGFRMSFLSMEGDPFITGKLAMVVDGNWLLGNIARYKPDMDFGIAPPPVPAGRPYTTWSGGFSLAIPRGAKHPGLAWEFIKWMSSVDAWRIRNRVLQQLYRSRGALYVPSLSANERVDDMILREFVYGNRDLPERYKRGLQTCVDLLKQSKFRAVSPVADKLWDQMNRAVDYATYHEKTPVEALKQSQKVVQDELLQLTCHNRTVTKEVNWWRISFFVSGALIAASLAVMLWKYRHIAVRGETRRALWAGIIFISPWVTGFVVLLLIPTVASIALSFTEYDVLHPAQFVGVKNYIDLMLHDPLFWKSLWNTSFMLLEVPLSLLIGLFIAILLNTKVKGIALFRALFYLPAVVPLVATSMLWMWILQPSNGLLNTFLGMCGIRGPMWLYSPTWSKPSLILMGLWSAGSGMIIWLAGLQGIPEVLYEAAEIDGAGKWSKFVHITIPMLTPYIFYNLVIGIIGTLQVFTSAYIVTNGEGGPVDSTLFYVFYLFNNAFRYFKMGYASAMSWVLFIIIIGLTLIQFAISKKWVYYEEGK